jgi:hypothetical protein
VFRRIGVEADETPFEQIRMKYYPACSLVSEQMETALYVGICVTKSRVSWLIKLLLMTSGSNFEEVEDSNGLKGAP